MTKAINFGSLNIDHVYKVDHIVRPGETLGSESYHVYCGGKGGNQSLALARAGAPVIHAGCIGRADGRILLDNLKNNGVDTRHVMELHVPSGHAVIQVDSSGENAIFLYAGANHAFEPDMVDRVLKNAEPGDLILLQNEINDIGTIMEKAAAAGLKLCFNFAPFDSGMAKSLPLHLLDYLIVNETEGAGLAGCSETDGILNILAERYPETAIILTLGPEGVAAISNGEVVRVPSPPADVVDTTSAGDTFIGYFLAACLRGESLERCCREACAAAAVAVSRPGAADSIPYVNELNIITTGNVR